MEHYKYLIIGGGMTANAAVQGIRSVDAAGKIGVIGAESDPPYDRPPLSKALWKGVSVDTIWRKTDQQDVTFHLGRTVTAIEPANKQVADSQGNRYSWDKLLLATGGSPRRLPFGDDHIIYFRTLADYRRLRALTEKGQRFAVIGGGFIGSEIAAALTLNQKKVVMIFPGKSIANRVFPNDLSQFVSGFYQQKGVEIVAGEKLSGLEKRGGQLVVKTSSSLEILVDGVVAGIGIEPNVELAQTANVKVEHGIVVDEFLRTSHPDIYAAGDVAAFHSPALAKRIRVEHEDNANTMGRLAGRNMAGQSEPYHHLPSFYSDMFELGYEAVGELDSRLETFADWKRPNKEGVIYYLHNGRVRGVLLWNVWGQVDAARALIAEPGPFRAENLKGRLK
ncbi:MAG: FAD-dependent oxidoreductase [Verrucomicrobia bacterium]|nr:FAD-dependent oxidoreductase [Verrucomicrobiota bacterium]